jgi:excisionase family DNA binding protein
METKTILVNNLDGQTLLNRLQAVENAVNALSAKFNPQQKELLTIKETCDLLKVCEVTLWKWTNTGKVTAYKIGNKVFYKYSELVNLEHRPRPVQK